MEMALETYQLGLPYPGASRAEKLQTISTQTPEIKPINTGGGGITTGPININRTPTISSSSNSGGNWWQRNNINFHSVLEVGGKLLDLGSGIADVRNKLRQDPNTPVYIVNQNTGQKEELSQNEKQQMVQRYEMGGQSAGMDYFTQLALMKGLEKKDNTLLYVGIGLGALVLVVGIIMAVKSK